MRTKFLLVIIICIAASCKSTQIINIGVDGEKCIKEAGPSEKSLTECVVFCRALKCLSALMENGKCFCTNEECGSNKVTNSEASAMLYLSRLKVMTPQPICYQGNNKKYAAFKVKHDGLIKYFKLIHINGSIECMPGSTGRWGCSPLFTTDWVMTIMTDADNQIITSTTLEGSHDVFQIPNFDGENSDHLTFTSDDPLRVVVGDEFRVWHTQDLNDFKADNNFGSHCIQVYAKYC
ncbi:uncharacterized protein [Clytia hemisphaerica]|uniref:Cnidarian restricted protein n=1 Tax=Clytia hemisphaerica TaxID=252671 RepID=A0A7M5X667_9CNID